MAQAKNERIQQVVITGQEITGTNKENNSFRTYAPDAVRGAGERAVQPRRRRQSRSRKRPARGRRFSIPGRRSC